MTLKWEKDSLLMNYSRLFVKENIWKIEFLGYDKEDFLQECFLVYLKCVNRFNGNEDALFFSLFKKSLRNVMLDLARKCSLEKRCLETIKEDMVENIGDAEKEVMCLFKIQEAPEDIRMYIRNSKGQSKQGKMFKKTKEYFLER